MEVLNAHAQPIEAEAPQSFQVLAGRHSRIDFNSNLGPGGERKPGAHRGKQIFDLLWSQIRRGAATPMKLNDLALLRNAAAHSIQFLFQHAEIRGSDALVFLDDYVAGTEQAQAFAKRNVHIEGDGSLRAFRFFVNSLQVVRSEGIVPDWRGRIAGVAGSGPVVAREKFFADPQLVAHLLQSWLCQGHRWPSTFNATARRHSFRLRNAPAVPSR